MLPRRIPVVHLLLVVLLPFSAATVIQANTIPALPPADTQSSVQDSKGNPLCSSDGITSSCLYGGASASGQIAGGGFNTAFAGTNTNLGAVSTTTYGFFVLGPSNVNIPLIIRGTALAQDNGQSNIAFDFINVLEASLGPLSKPVLDQFFSSTFGCSQLTMQDPTTPCMSPSSYSYHISIPTNSIDVITIGAAAAGGGNASASIDPSIMIDPSFANASQFSLVASDGVFSAATPTVTPEPSSLALLGTGIATVWGASKRRLRRS